MKIRERAADILLRWSRSPLTIDKFVERESEDLGVRERALLEELCFGSMRRRLTLDFLIKRFSRVSPGKIRGRVREILRLAIYQILFLEHVPEGRAVDLAVRMVNREFPEWTASFVNALLRKLLGSFSIISILQADPFSRRILPLDQRRGILFSEEILPSPRRDLAGFLSVAYSHPKWIVERWLRFFGRERVVGLCSAGNERPVHFLRVNSLKGCRKDLIDLLSGEGFDVEPAALPCSIRTRNLLPLLSHRTFREGWFYPQDVTAMRASLLLDPQPGERVLDLCAAPGGKTTHMAELMKDQGEVVAVDSSKGRLALLEENLRRLGLTIVEPIPMDGRRLRELSLGEFDRVMADVPCTNTGVFRRRPGVRWRIRFRDLSSLTALQLSLLEEAFHVLREGGVLVYSTCSLEPEEGEERIKALAEKCPGAELVEARLYFPEKEGGEGGYMAKVRKAGA